MHSEWLFIIAKLPASNVINMCEWRILTVTLAVCKNANAKNTQQHKHTHTQAHKPTHTKYINYIYLKTSWQFLIVYMLKISKLKINK